MKDRGIGTLRPSKKSSRRPRTINERRKTAYHEAGHVIACEALDVLHGGLSVKPKDDGTNGRVFVEGDDHLSCPPGVGPYSPEVEAQFRVWAETQAVIDYAGHAAVVALLGVGNMSDASARENGAGQDFQKARKRLGANRQRIKQAKAHALDIVSARRHDLKKLADAAVKYGQLNGDQVDFVLTDSPFLELSLKREQRQAKRQSPNRSNRS